jgi:ATP-dependent RNA helicase RhlE
VKKIIAQLPKEKQTILFSATMPEEIEDIAARLMKNPVKVEVTPQATTVEKIGQSVVFLERQKKGVLLQQIIKDKNINCGLVFSRTKHGCDKIVRILENYGITAAAIHGNKSQNARERALKDFKDGRVAILVATDIAARGIDIPGVAYVFNYDIPNDPSSYVHRIGRTARAGREGLAVAFCDDSEKSLLRSVEKLIKQRIVEDRELTQLAQTLPAPVQKRSSPAPRSQSYGNNESQERSPNRDNFRRKPQSRSGSSSSSSSGSGSNSGNRSTGRLNRFSKRTERTG